MDLLKQLLDPHDNHHEGKKHYNALWEKEAQNRQNLSAKIFFGNPIFTLLPTFSGVLYGKS